MLLSALIAELQKMKWSHAKSAAHNMSLANVGGVCATQRDLSEGAASSLVAGSVGFWILPIWSLGI